MSKNLTKYIASFDYIDKFLILLSATNGRISIASFATVTGGPVGLTSSSLSLTFSTGILTTRNKKKNHNKIVMLARSKLNNTESKMSEALTNNEISHEDFMTIINEEKTFEN